MDKIKRLERVTSVIDGINSDKASKAEILTLLYDYRDELRKGVENSTGFVETRTSALIDGGKKYANMTPEEKKEYHRVYNRMYYLKKKAINNLNGKQ